MAVDRSHTPFERLLALITRIRPGEGRPVALFGAHVFLILFAYYIFRSVREGFLLDSGSAERGSYATAGGTVRRGPSRPPPPRRC